MKYQTIKTKTETNFVTKVSVMDTLLAIDVGASVIIPQNKIKVGSLRVAAFRLEKKKKGKFYITENGLINETHVMRLK